MDKGLLAYNVDLYLASNLSAPPSNHSIISLSQIVMLRLATMFRNVERHFCQNAKHLDLETCVRGLKLETYVWPWQSHQ
jgi:hypothetical protein